MIQDGDKGREAKAGQGPRPPLRQGGGPTPAVENLIACPINEAFVLVLGAGVPMSGAQAVMLNGDPTLPGKAPVVSWPLADPKGRGSHGFVALVFAGPLKGERLNTLAFRAQGRAASYRVSPDLMRPATLAAALIELAGAHLPAVIDAIVAMLSQGPMSRRKLTAMTTFVEASAKADGFIEIIGAFEEGDVYLQGWSSDVRAGVSRVLIAGSTAQIAECTGAAFDRQDLASTGKGFAAVLVAPEPIDPFGMQRVYFRGRDGWRYSDVYEQRLLASPRDTPGYARAILPKVRGSAEVVGRLRDAAYRYEGLDTVSGLALPVRMAIDHAFRVEQGGLLVGGWLLDPDHRVESVKLRRRQVTIELRETWSRIERPDVSSAFDGKAPFPARFDQNQHGHGFAVFIPDFDADGGAPVYIELTIPHCPPAYLPVVPKRVSYREAVSRQLKSISARAAAMPEIVERHLIPLVASAATKAPAAERIEHVGTNAPAGDTTLVIGLDEQTADVASLVALLALDAEVRAAPIVLAGPDRVIATLRGEMRRLAEFYGLSIQMVAVAGCNDVYDALIVGSGAAKTDRVVLFSGSLVPAGRGWFGRLCAAHRETDATAIISPALLYEDDSIRWAGYRLGGEDGGLAENYVGYPVATLATIAPAATPVANLECCIVAKAAIASLGQGGHGYLGNRAKGLDLALRLSKTGLKAYWLPAVRLLGAEAPVDRLNAWEAHARNIDRAVLDARWSDTIAAMTQAVAA
ncbi:hypothetical protein K32_18970 [Kaistia sp. 32K]|uniref:hypothetical protein n=1 Tax=Kaistia sp. 32K TaxID=2795690 RepID=UPI001916C1AA|nr:hypothetical protein [Kaistia sp. 32K]BCP53280.1 hypothetical protein K32_18970 [Kaistia sp. 32K]